MDGPWSQPSISLVGIFLSLILVPGALYFYLAHPDWSWLYLVDPDRIPRLAIVPIVAAHVGALIGSYHLGGRFVRARKIPEKQALAGIASVGGLLLLIAFLCRRRLLHYGTYSQYHDGRALRLAEVKLGYVLIAVLVGVVCAAAFTAWELLRDGRRAVSR